MALRLDLGFGFRLSVHAVEDSKVGGAYVVRVRRLKDSGSGGTKI